MREKITFEPNEPQLITLDGKPTLSAGRFGDEYQYFLGKQRIMWVKPELHEAIAQCGATSGDEICITKMERRTGNKRRVEWIVEKVQEEPAPAKAPEIAARSNGAALPKAYDPPKQSNSQAQDFPGWPVEENRESSLRTAQATLQTGPEQIRMANPLATALCLAIEAAALASEYAIERGLPQLNLRTEDIRALAITAYINAFGNQKGRAA